MLKAKGHKSKLQQSEMNSSNDPVIVSGEEINGQTVLIVSVINSNH